MVYSCSKTSNLVWCWCRDHLLPVWFFRPRKDEGRQRSSVASSHSIKALSALHRRGLALSYLSSDGCVQGRTPLFFIYVYQLSSLATCNHISGGCIIMMHHIFQGIYFSYVGPLFLILDHLISKIIGRASPWRCTCTGWLRLQAWFSLFSQSVAMCCFTVFFFCSSAHSEMSNNKKCNLIASPWWMD